MFDWPWVIAPRNVMDGGHKTILVTVYVPDKREMTRTQKKSLDFISFGDDKTGPDDQT